MSFGVSDSQFAVDDWVNTVKGYGWNYMNSIATTKEDNIVAVGSFSSYSPEIVSGTENGIYINDDDEIDKISLGKNDGLIILYDKNGELIWSKAFGGKEDDSLNKVIATSDGGIVAVGYTSSNLVYLDGLQINALTRASDQARKDGIILKLDSEGNYIWGTRIGGLEDDDIKAVIETSENNLAIVGYGDSIKGYIASYSLQNGTLQWKQSLKNWSNWDWPAEKEQDSPDVRDVVQCQDLLIVATSNTIEGYHLTGEREYAVSLNKDGNIYKVICIDTDIDGNLILGSELNSDTQRWEVTIDKIDAYLKKLPVKNIYTLEGTYDDYIADIKATSDGGIIFGGWTYSPNLTGTGLDGIYAIESGNVNNPNAYVIKLDKNNQVEFASSFSGNKYNGVLSVTESNRGKIISAGYFSSPELSITNFNNVNTEETNIKINKIGNSEGFVIAQGLCGTNIPELQVINIENQLKRFEITTNVKIGEDGEKGGTITGSYQTGESEIVTYGNNSTEKITITPDTAYKIKCVTINGKEVKNLSPENNSKEKIEHGYTINDDGTITLELFENVKENKAIEVEFSNAVSNVIVNHYLWPEETPPNEVAESEYYSDTIESKYEVLPKIDLPDYELITNLDYYGDDIPPNLDKDDYYIPENARGEYKANETIVVNYYYKEKTYTLTVHHYLEGTNTPVPLKDSETGESVPDEVSNKNKDGVPYKKGTAYETHQASEDKINYRIYELALNPKNATGIIESDTEVTYYYRVKTNSLKIVKVAKEDNSIKLADTNFSLYKLVCTEHEKGHHDSELIKYKNDNIACWEKVGEYVTDDNGEITLNNLSPIDEYRLVETKAADGRNNSRGQWNFEFVLGEYDKNDENILEVDEGNIIRVTKIGDASNIKVQDGRILIENEKGIDSLPLTGGTGNTLYYITGTIIAIFALGALIYKKNN